MELRSELRVSRAPAVVACAFAAAVLIVTLLLAFGVWQVAAGGQPNATEQVRG